jgi:hypothetical protein
MSVPHSTPPAKLLQTFKFLRVPPERATSEKEEEGGSQATLVATRAQLLAGQICFLPSFALPCLRRVSFTFLSI